MTKTRIRAIAVNDEIGFFAPRKWAFWRALIICFCLCCLMGHWFEIPYCTIMNRFFGIASDGYAVWTDPWYHPYWVYGIGAVVMTFVLEPLKERIMLRTSMLAGSLLTSFVVMVFLAMLMELVIGFIVNRPDAAGVYPYWDNSTLPGNVFGQAWLVNDVFIGIAAMFYLWIVYPLVCKGFIVMGGRRANIAFAVLVVAFVCCCTASYVQLVLTQW